MGPTAIEERALVTALAPQGVGKLGYGQFSMNGLVGWGAVSAQAQLQGEPDPKPNTRPWQHLPDLDALTERLWTALG